VGLAGELYLGGDGLALGYHELPELTKVAFIDSPFGPGLLYRTGDLARYRADGNIQFLGRRDFQVKVRGFRVEPEEIESVLLTNPSVEASAIVAFTDHVGSDQWLAAYVVLKESGAATDLELRGYLRTKLPEYMIPSSFVFLGELPKTAAGKVDRRRLPAPQRATTISPEAAIGPGDTLETRLKAIWEDVLRRGPIGIDDNFFDVGGHSLAAVLLFARVEKALGVKLPISVLLQAQTIRSMARFLRVHEGEHSKLWSPLVPLQTLGSGPPLFLVHAADGVLLNYAQLVKSLGTGRPIYGLQTRGLDGRSPPYGSVEEMASDYVTAVRSVQPEGPYFLLGFSSGGVTAFEMGVQLTEGGSGSDPGIGHKGNAGLLMILDTLAPTWEESQRYADRRDFINNTASIFSNMLIDVRKGAVRKAIRDLPSSVTRNLLTALRAMGLRSSPAEPKLPFWASELPENRKTIVLALMRATRNYRPRKYPGKIVLFKPHLLPLLRPRDPLMGWGALAAKGVECVTVGKQIHGDMLQPLNSEKLAQEIKRLTDAVKTGQ
jgi:thioesterase domain-containing protein/acyl carrier protein